MEKLWNSFKIAFSMYSKIPMPASDWKKENMRYIMCFFPLIGAIIGGVVWLWGFYGRYFIESKGFYAMIFVMIPVFLTGGIHLDGLLDTSDAIHSYQPRERKLEILKDSHAGAFAIITAVVYFFLYYGIYHEITLKSLPVVCIGFVLSRALGSFSIASFPMAKNTGLAATFSDGAQKNCVRIVSCVYMVLCVCAMLAYNPIIGACTIVGVALEYLYYYCELVIAFSCVIGEIISRMM